MIVVVRERAMDLRERQLWVLITDLVRRKCQMLCCRDDVEDPDPGTQNAGLPAAHGGILRYVLVTRVHVHRVRYLTTGGCTIEKQRTVSGFQAIERMEPDPGRSECPCVGPGNVGVLGDLANLI